MVSVCWVWAPGVAFTGAPMVTMIVLLSSYSLLSMRARVIAPVVSPALMVIGFGVMTR